MKIYKCEKTYFESNLQPRVKRVINKLEKYNKEYKFNIIKETIEILPILNKYGIKIGDMLVDVVNYEFEMEEIKHGDYEVQAMVKHNKLEDGTYLNEIHSFRKDREEIGAAFRNVKPNCNHCKHNRGRVKTFILVDTNTAETLQIGSSCINEFIGIDILKITGIKEELDDIIKQNEMSIYEDRIQTVKSYYSIKDILQTAINIIKKEGYDKNNIKMDVENTMIHEEIKDYTEAEEIINYFKSLDDDKLNEFESNTKVNLTKEYHTYISGYITYSYLLYKKLIENEKIKEQNRNNSKYIGNIKDKIELNLTLKKTIPYETQYGFSYFHHFEDNDGNSIIWSTGKCLNEDEYTLKGTIKAHGEYMGIKQTYITRCKII